MIKEESKTKIGLASQVAKSTFDMKIKIISLSILILLNLFIIISSEAYLIIENHSN